MDPKLDQNMIFPRSWDFGCLELYVMLSLNVTQFPADSELAELIISCPIC